MNDKVLVLNNAPKVDKLYTIKGSRNNSAREEVLDAGIPGLSMAQDICQDLKEQYGTEYDVWIVEEKE